MTLEQYAYLGEIIAALAVMASLIVVAMEVRKNTVQSKIANWGSAVDRFNAVYSQTSDIQLADLVAKGRQSYHTLTDGEKISFGHYLEQILIAQESLLVLARDSVHEKETTLELFRKHTCFHLGYPGAREWFDEFEDKRGFPPLLSRAVHEAID